jgi:hypothetical protein
MEENGRLIRLFPVPFRLVSDDKQFKKWQWITARVAKASNDHRQESHKLSLICSSPHLLARERLDAVGPARFSAATSTTGG